MIMKKLLLLLVLIFPVFSAKAQLQFFRYDSVPVYIGTQQLLFPWAGGMNFCQFSSIDLDLDGTDDLFVFDRSGNRITTYLNHGTPNQVDYTLAPQYVGQFPQMHDWVILRDYNCDGKMDIFTSSGTSIPGIMVYKNISTTAGLQWQLVSRPLVTDAEPNTTGNPRDTIFITTVDIPAVRDIDHDGDLDILTFDGGGVHVLMDRNMSMETYGVCDSLIFQRETNCWGDFAENTLNASLTLNDSCSAPLLAPDENFVTLNRLQDLHNGSCLECINTDGDNDEDVIIGDISNAHVAYARNGGSNQFARMDTVDPQFPGYDVPMLMNLFSCAYHLDVDNDGKRDLIFSPNAMNVSENYHSAWLYHNTGSDDSVRVTFVKNNFLQDEMIEVGEGAFPRFFDYDNDGDNDLFIGNYSYYSSSNPLPSSIALYKNIGSSTFPSYKLITTDFALLDSLNMNIPCPVPTFADIDGDGDEDMIVGDAIGTLHYFRKDPGPNDNFVLVQNNYMGIDVGYYATPQLVDVNRDGLFDLLIGERDAGNINYYQNIGTATAPNFALITPLFGNIRVAEASVNTGYSVPCLWDDNGNYVLLVGSERGFLFRYDNIDGNLSGNFTLTDSLYVSRHEGLRIAPWVADINNDTVPDLIIGNYAGGVSLFLGDIGTGIAQERPVVPFFDLVPNPASGNVRLHTDLKNSELPATLVFYTVTGQEALRQALQSPDEEIGISGLSPGIYIVAVRSATGKVSHRKLIVQ